MNRRLFAPAVVLLVICFSCCAFGAQTEVKYDKQGFSVTLPSSFEKRVQSGSGRVVSDVYVVNGLGFFAAVISVPPDTLSSTAIEQALQAAYKQAPKDGSARRWEMNSRHGDLFKGISRSVEVDDDIYKAMPCLNELLENKPGFLAISMVALGDDSSPVLSVGVVGPQDREMEIEAEAKGFAHTVKRLGAGSDMKPKPNAAVKKQPNRPAEKPTLKKGQIELVGVVQSLNPKQSSLLMLVDEVTEPGHGTARLDPARPKVVYAKTIAREIAAGTRVMVIGKDSGVGKPITARILKSTGKN